MPGRRYSESLTQERFRAERTLEVALLLPKPNKASLAPPGHKHGALCSTPLGVPASPRCSSCFPTPPRTARTLLNRELGPRFIPI